MLNAAINVALVTLMFVWDRTIGVAIPLSVLDRMLTRKSEATQKKVA